MEARGQQGRAGVLVTAAVALLVVGAVLAIGGAHPLTQVVLSTGALALFCAYAATRKRVGIRPVPFALTAAVGLAATLLQLVPLPAAIVSVISPAAYQLRSDTGAAAFMPLTVDTPATWLALARGAACTGLLLVVGSFVHSVRHARRLLWIPAGVAAGLGVIALVQRISGTHAILGLYTPRSWPGFGIFGTFVDVNHAASVLALGMLVAIGLAIDSFGRQREAAIACALAAGIALFCTSSRGGLFGFGVAAYVLTIVVIARRVGVARAVIAATVVFLVAAAVLVWTNEGLRSRLSAPTELIDNQKTRGWIEALRMSRDYPWIGVGRGAFAAPIGAYRHVDEGVRLVYPENVVAEMLSEWGIPVTIAIVALFLAAAARLVRALAKMPAAIVAAACGVLAVLIHELFDFGLEFPGVAFPTVVTLAIVVGAVGREQSPQPRRRFRLTPAYLAPLAVAWALTLGAAARATTRTLDADWQRMHQADERDAVEAASVEAAIRRHPADDYLELIAARAALRHDPAQAMRHVNRALVLHPANAQAHRLAARLLVAARRPAQAALEYRLAAADGMVLSTDELVRLLGAYVVDAVAPTPAALEALARELYGIHRPAEADAAARHAVDVSDDREAALVARTQLAMEFNNRPAIVDAAKALAAEASRVESFTAAAQAFAAVGDRAHTEATLTAGEQLHPRDSALLLVGVRALLDLGDAAAARAMLDGSARVSFTLPQRQKAEELLAEAADRLGDSDTAVVARARARLIARQLQDMSLSK